jgi:hypothetical protein
MGEEITGYDAIDSWANHRLPYIRRQDAETFRKKLRKLKGDPEQLLHTLRELILGAFLAKNGFTVEYEREIDRHTPDWSIVDNNSEIVGIVELRNFHGDRKTEMEIKQGLATGGLWVGRLPPSSSRLHDRLWKKFAKYKDLTNRLRVPFVVALQVELSTTVNPEDLEDCLYSDEHGLFNQYPEVSGLIAFSDGSGYFMNYVRNSKALRPIQLPQGFP